MDLTLDNYRIAPLAITTNSPVSTPAPRTQQPAPVTSAPVTPAPTVSEPTIPAVTAGVYGLSSNVTLQETGSMNESASQLWWLNSGGYFTVQDGIGKTVQGSLPANDKWRLAYASGNARDTDDGYHPQNLFRLLTRSTYKNVQQEGYFKINDYILSDTDLRAEHNGILFFNRYRDGTTLYYKSGVFPGTYNRNSNPNLIPENTWVGIRSIVKDLAGGKVSIKVFVDKSGNGNWEQVIDMVDDGSSGSVITGAAYAGIRSDYMDLEVKGYKVSEI
jgi:hypothetical protein